MEVVTSSLKGMHMLHEHVIFCPIQVQYTDVYCIQYIRVVFPHIRIVFRIFEALNMILSVTDKQDPQHPTVACVHSLWRPKKTIESGGHDLLVGTWTTV